MKKQILIPPKNGWKQGYYVVEVAKHDNNPIHSCIMSVGFVQDEKPSGIFNYIFNLSHEPESCSIKEYRYIKAIRKIDMSILNQSKTIAYDELKKNIVQCDQQDDIFNILNDPKSDWNIPLTNKEYERYLTENKIPKSAIIKHKLKGNKNVRKIIQKSKT